MTSEYNRSAEGLVASYNFNSENENIYDISEYLTPANLTEHNLGTIAGTKSAKNNRKIYISSKPVNKILNSVKATGAYSIECWIKSADPIGERLQQIISIENYSGKLFSLGQANNNSNVGFEYMVNFRTNSTNDQGKPDFPLNKQFDFHSINHLVYTKDKNGHEKFFLNGELLNESMRPSALDDWFGDYYLIIGSTINGLDRWNGSIYYLSLYNKALQESIVKHHYEAGAYPGFHLENRTHKVEIYPNPATEYLNISIIPVEHVLSGEKTQYLVLNSMGQIIECNTILDPSVKNDYHLDLSKYKPGLYYLMVKSKSQLLTKKFIITNQY